jgi:hypothetical protein
MSPNPTDGVFVINVPSDRHHYDLTISDIKGKIVFQMNFNGTNSSANIANCPSGLYFCRVLRDDGAVAIRKLVIQ